MSPIVLTRRQVEEIRFAVNYLKYFNHGTPGHNHLVLIAELAKGAAANGLSIATDGAQEGTIEVFPFSDVVAS